MRIALVVVTLLALAAPAAAEVDYEPPAHGPVETAAKPVTVDGWNIIQFAQGGELFKGMEIACNQIKKNADVDNRFAQSPSWFGNQDVAYDYAIRATAKAYLKTQTSVVGGKIENFDERVASLARFTAVRPLVLFPIIDENNIKRLLAAIRGKVDGQLATPIGVWLGKQEWLGEEDEDFLMVGTDEFYKMLYRMGRRADRAAIDDYIRKNGHRPLGMTEAEMTFMYQKLVAGGWPATAATRRVVRRNQKAAARIVDELIRLQRQWFVVRFATGYGMTWEEQKAVLGAGRVAARNLTGVAAFDAGMGEIVYALKYNGAGPFAKIGHGETHFNRISMMDKDLELLGVIKEYVNVDGYWAPEVPSLWHRGRLFHSEIALHSPRFAVEFTGQCVAPDPDRSAPMRDLADDD